MELPESKLVLPKLPYSLNSLEPIISGEAMKTHYLGHHKGYVDTYNKLLEEGGKIEDREFNYFGHILHSILWTCLTPTSIMNSEIKTLILKKYQSINYFLENLIEKTMSIKGSGWLLLDKNFKFLTIPNHDLSNVGEPPILVLDQWEHFFYLDFKNKKKDFMEKIVFKINWDMVLKRLNYYYCA